MFITYIETRLQKKKKENLKFLETREFTFQRTKTSNRGAHTVS